MAGRSVCVVGGGLSGLACARLILQQGGVVTLLEASDTLGGALLAAPVGGMSGQYFLPEHARVADLARELGLDVEEKATLPFVRPNLVRDRVYDRCRRYLEDEARANARARPDRVHDANVPFGGELQFFRVGDYLEQSDRERVLYLPQGYGVLIRRLAADVRSRGARVELGTRCVQLQTQTSGRGVVVYDNALRGRTFDFVVLAMGSASLLGVARASPSHAWLADTAKASVFVPSTRVYMNAAILHHRAPRTLFGESEYHVFGPNTSFRWATVENGAPLLLSYSDGEHSRWLQTLRAERGDAAVGRMLLDSLRNASLPLRAVLPTPEQVPARAFWFSPQGLGFHASLDVPPPKLNDGRVFCAGESTSSPALRAWMEGALESAERAARLR